jgi:hypothetical protein
MPQPNPMPIQSPTLPPSPTPGIDTITANLLNQVYRLQDFMPLEGSDSFVVPTKAEQSTFSEIVSRLEAGDLLYASNLARRNNYRLVRYLDLGDERAASYLLREEIPISKGWGLYMIRADVANNIIVEAPHPISDKNTDLIALNIYRVLNARALLIAGAHRSADPNGLADVAHTTESIFNSIHETLIKKTTKIPGAPVVLQIHGFAANKHPGYPNIILGFGQTASQEEISLSRELVDALSAFGVNADTCEGDSWQDLCATKNTQGSDKKKVIFIHIELDETIRDDGSILISALSQVFAKRNPLTP